jgi:hypothetical protein
MISIISNNIRFIVCSLIAISILVACDDRDNILTDDKQNIPLLRKITFQHEDFHSIDFKYDESDIIDTIYARIGDHIQEIFVDYQDVDTFYRTRILIDNLYLSGFYDSETKKYWEGSTKVVEILGSGLYESDQPLEHYFVRYNNSDTTEIEFNRDYIWNRRAIVNHTFDFDNDNRWISTFSNEESQEIYILYSFVLRPELNPLHQLDFMPFSFLTAFSPMLFHNRLLDRVEPIKYNGISMPVATITYDYEFDIDGNLTKAVETFVENDKDSIGNIIDLEWY